MPTRRMEKESWTWWMGNRLILIDMGSDGWAEVEKNGEKGVVPASYVQEV